MIMIPTCKKLTNFNVKFVCNNTDVQNTIIGFYIISKIILRMKRVSIIFDNLQAFYIKLHILYGFNFQAKF